MLHSYQQRVRISNNIVVNMYQVCLSAAASYMEVYSSMDTP